MSSGDPVTLFTAMWAFKLPSDLNSAKHMTTPNINFDLLMEPTVLLELRTRELLGCFNLPDGFSLASCDVIHMPTL